ncbi:hypothetical protein HPP92_021407 [Vanilla planifolia]|uniref:Uncharacterized protein n=1 Tax=Vanilla planifolia TaxID=51239 RepID=A0A835UHJ1_VANPL|nr:hypothetical protein HPP92_021407 [Vanilla planifolia]
MDRRHQRLPILRIPDLLFHISSGCWTSGITLPISFAIVAALSACANVGALNVGRGLHSYMKKTGMEIAEFVATALINMYSKCGSIQDTPRVLIQYLRGNNTNLECTIHGLAVHGLAWVRRWPKESNIGRSSRAWSYVQLDKTYLLMSVDIPKIISCE